MPKKKHLPTTPVTARTLGRGALDKDHQSIFDWEHFTVHWRGPTKKHSTLSTQASSSSTTSDDDTDESVVINDNNSNFTIDLTTDNAYHSKEEYKACQEIRAALTVEELEAMPDWAMPLRHLRAEKGDISKAIDAIKHTLAWRKEFQVDKVIAAFDKSKNTSSSSSSTPDDNNDVELDYAAILTQETETGKIYTRGYDKDGRACMYMRPGNENTDDTDNNMRHLVYQLEKAVACSNKNGHGKICLMIDYEGFHVSKAPPMSTTRKVLEILQRHYAERMYRAYVCNPPLYFRTFYAIIKPFVDPVTKQKVCFAIGKKGMDQIVDDMGGHERAMRHLEKCAGGVEELRPFDNVEYLNAPFNHAFDEQNLLK